MYYRFNILKLGEILVNLKRRNVQIHCVNMQREWSTANNGKSTNNYYKCQRKKKIHECNRNQWSNQATFQWKRHFLPQKKSIKSDPIPEYIPFPIDNN